ncbi:glycosyltransferase [Epibacterium ulvae]|uniref:glycosyltransferase n=1 Tax=Epibacterium ulvae TaxID=1156985 RepID=UPI0024912235|nr:glycosyltransferase [Epibacterium ulvae]
MDDGNLLEDVAQVRRQVIALCSKKRFSAAQMFLVGSGQSPDLAPGLWEHIARSAAQAGHDPIAQAIRAEIWAAGGSHEGLTLDEAAYALKNNQAQAAIFTLESAFGLCPTRPDALALLTQAYMQQARQQQKGSRLRIDPEIAQRLTKGGVPQTPQHAMAAIDLLRYAGELDQARAFNAAATIAFPDDLRFVIRRARMAEQKGQFESAITIWQQIAKGSTRYQRDAQFHLLNLYQRLERFEDAEQITAALLLSDLALEDRIQLALKIGQRAVMLALLRALSASPPQIQNMRHQQGCAIGEALLDHGEIGLLLWLRRRRMPLGDGVKQVLDACAFGALDGPEMPEDFDSASQIRSPDFMLPLECFAGLPATPPGWPGRRTAPGRVLLVNASLKAGGAERQFVALIKALLQAGLAPQDLHVAVFSLEKDRGRAAFLSDLAALGVEIHSLEALQIENPTLPAAVARIINALPFDLRQDVPSLWHLIQRLSPQILHGWQDRASATCGLAGVLCNVERLVLSMRNMAPNSRYDHKLSTLKHLFLSLAARSNVTFTANAEAAARDYETWLSLPKGHVHPLRNIIEPATFAPLHRPYIVRQTNPDMTLGGVFRLALNKRPLLWLQTVAALRHQTDLSLRPVIFGTGPLLDPVLAEARRLGLEDLTVIQDVTAPGQIYRDMDLLLLMSRVEGLPNVLLEAQAAGLPVAACDVGGVREALQRRGAAGALLLPADIIADKAATEIAHWLPRARAAKIDPRVGFIRKNFSQTAVTDPLIQIYCGQGAAS